MQTAVGWLIEQMLINNYTSKQQIENAHWLINEAKEMERLQLIDAQSYAISNADMTNNKGYFDCDKWYDETYGSETNSEKPNLSGMPTSSQTENKGLDWLVSHWKKLQLEGEKMSWEQIIKITELAKENKNKQYGINNI